MSRIVISSIGGLIAVMFALACGAHGSGGTGGFVGVGASGTCPPGSLCPGSSTGPTQASNSATNATSSSTGSSGSSMHGISCPMNYCSVGMGGYAFSYADGDPPANTPTGMSHATLTAGEACISGNVMALPADPTQTDYSNDWGCGMGINLNQAKGTMASDPDPLTGNGVLVATTGVPLCTTARVVLTVGGTDYCAPLTDGSLIPWSVFNTSCWNGTGVSLSGPPSVTQLKVQFVTSAIACSFSDFCITNILL
jgi:hypothetical protein